LAWAYFKEGDLRDCHIKTCRGYGPTGRVKRLAVPYLVELLDHFSPHALLVPRVAGDGGRSRSPRVAQMIRGTVREAVKRGIAVHVVSSSAIQLAFCQAGMEAPTKKDEIHNAILDRFPELTTMVPKARLKIWEPEDYFTPLFNAVAMYVAWDNQLVRMEDT
jgi:hypothetical protein